jgi:hypothetical protein
VKVTIDGLEAEVDDVRWHTDTTAVEAEVRAARAGATDLTGLHEVPDWDYDSLVKVFGEAES